MGYCRDMNKESAIKISEYGSTKLYRFGKWSVRVSRTTISEKAGCGLRYNTSITSWSAIDNENPTPEFNKSGHGGIRDAVKKLA
jgi:hypothetical protein